MTQDAIDTARPRHSVPVLEDLPDPSGKAVLVRATFDRPLAADPALPLALVRARGLASTVEWLTERGARVTVCGDAAASGPAEEVDRLDQIRRAVVSLLSSAATGEPVAFRSCPEQLDTVERLVDDYDLFVNDTLQDSSLPLPSVTAPPARRPAAAGRTLEQDLRILSPLLVAPARPFVAVLGGARSSDRLHGLRGLVLRADTVLLGGALALPLLQAVGKQPPDGTSDEFLWECRTAVGLSKRVRHQIVLPLDLVWKRRDGSTVTTPADVRGGEQVVDIGPVTRVRFAEFLRGAAVTLWAGAVGRVEDDPSAQGSRELARALRAGSPVVLGGDALVGALQAAGLVPSEADMLSATDAAIELLKAGDLPGLAALRH